MKRILNLFLLTTLLISPISPVMGNWKDSLESYKNKAKNIVTDKKNIKPAILFVISALAATKSKRDLNQTKVFNAAIEGLNKVSGKMEQKYFESEMASHVNNKSEYLNSAIISAIVSVIFAAWGLNSVINNSKK